MKTLNIIGAGRVGRTLAALWCREKSFDIQDVLNRTPGSTSDAVAFIGAGSAARALAVMRPADVWLLAMGDRDITRVAIQLAASGVPRAGDVVFQCSGALPSSELRGVIPARVSVCSVHPLKSFADSADAVRTFSGTYCVAEGEAVALALLKPAFERIGARVTEIDPVFKTVYHAASVIVCNYLTALMETGLQCYEKAGLPRETASLMMEPLVRETVDNVFRFGPAKALTGPIARGDAALVERQLTALGGFDPRIAEIYRALGSMAAELSRARGGADADGLHAIETLLETRQKP